MEQFIEFMINHPLLVGALAALTSALVFTEMRKGGQTISTGQLTMLVNQDKAIVIDVRDKTEFSKGHIVNSISIPHLQLKERVPELKNRNDKTIIIVDAMGQHSGSVGKTLKAAGIAHVARLQGGMNTWSSDNLPVVKK